MASEPRDRLSQAASSPNLQASIRLQDENALLCEQIAMLSAELAAKDLELQAFEQELAIANQELNLLNQELLASAKSPLAQDPTSLLFQRIADVLADPHLLALPEAKQLAQDLQLLKSLSSRVLAILLREIDRHSAKPDLTHSGFKPSSQKPQCDRSKFIDLGAQFIMLQARYRQLQQMLLQHPQSSQSQNFEGGGKLLECIKFGH
ncbi:hypothetical protein H6F67_14655 [Microcoleus sp. FACHB-1515]|uniref:hypothetical protein n=1 Tax=Cyanophyceae TaxID=3028117 RepID=UPI0016833117|nr:hypothetical protein [Microcoleus sp. FACHB-1515]MBD2091092.1 hypothetical protein [Microcoleus sp. FACHB-1515]